MKCPTCTKEVDTLRSSVHNGKYVSARCENCLASYKQSAVYARKHARDRDREDHRKDTIQRFEGDKVNPDFVRAYPKEAATQFGPEILRKSTNNKML